MSEPAINKSFEERMFEQIKSQMGDLLTQEELAKILETAIDKAFFQDRIVKSGYSNDVKEPLFVEMIRKELKPYIAAASSKWLADNQEKVSEILKQQISDNAAQFVANAFSTLMNAPMQQFAYDLQARLGAQGVQI